MIDVLRMWSASLPAIFGWPARPWNGRKLTQLECKLAREAFHVGGAQAAFEWLSAHAW